MLQVFIGAVSGIFSGIGMGGGTILIFLLTTFSGLEQHIAQATNLIYFVPTAISTIIVNYKDKNIDLGLASIVSICGAIGAVLGSIISVNVDVSVLRKLFGIFLLFIALHEIYSLYKMAVQYNNKT